MQIQKLVPIRQDLPHRQLGDVAIAVCEAMEQAAWTQQVKSGSHIAVGVGSRGIRNINVIAKAVVDFWKSRDAKPFIIPVMGSHGAASAAGQADVLAHYGITESTMGVPVVSSLDVVPVGKTNQGIDVSMDRQALDSDGVMLCGRVKWHTDFEGSLESGIHKMMAIGLGKWEGAKRYHSWALRIGMEQVIREVGAVVLETNKMLGGLAILEDAHHNTAEVHALGADGMAEQEEKLLSLTKSWKANLPAADVDLLVVDEIGKDISGAGMDTKVVNRAGPQGPNSWKDVPKVRRLYIRGLTDNTYGNAIGMGLADLAHDRVLENIDYQATWVNALTASATQPAFTPIHYPSDRECIEKVLTTCGKLDTLDCSITWIRNTLDLEDVMVSENLLPELESNRAIQVLGPAQELQFDATGNLESPLKTLALKQHAA